MHYVVGFGVFSLFAVYYMVIVPRFQKRAAAKLKAERDKPVDPAELAPEVARLALPEEKQVLTSVVQRDVNFLASYVHGLREGRWDDRTYVCRMFEDLIDRDMLEYALHQHPQSAVHFLLRGCLHHSWAWKQRGHGSAGEVGEEGWRGFHAGMETAEQDLLRAAALDPTDPTPYAMLVAVACHLDRGEGTAYAYVTEALRRDPESYAALDHYLNYFCAPHWGGSAERSLDFARRHAAGAPAGSVRPMLLLEAHYYVFHHECAFGDRERGDAHLADPAVQQEVLAAYHASIGHPAHRPSRRTNELRNLAAWWFYMMRDRERCARELTAIGGAFTDSYWQRLGPADKQLAAVRKWVTGGRWKEVGW